MMGGLDQGLLFELHLNNKKNSGPLNATFDFIQLHLTFRLVDHRHNSDILG